MSVTKNLPALQQLIQQARLESQLRPMLAGGVKNLSFTMNIDDSGTSFSINASDAAGNTEHYSKRSAVTQAPEPEPETPAE